jgi:hypothetical protein
MQGVESDDDDDEHTSSWHGMVDRTLLQKGWFYLICSLQNRCSHGLGLTPSPDPFVYPKFDYPSDFSALTPLFWISTPPETYPDLDSPAQVGIPHPHLHVLPPYSQLYPNVLPNASWEPLLQHIAELSQQLPGVGEVAAADIFLKGAEEEQQHQEQAPSSGVEEDPEEGGVVAAEEERKPDHAGRHGLEELHGRRGKKPQPKCHQDGPDEVCQPAPQKRRHLRKTVMLSAADIQPEYHCPQCVL